MTGRSRKYIFAGLLCGAVLAVIIVVSVVYWVSAPRKAPGPMVEAPRPGVEVQPTRKDVLTSTLGGRWYNGNPQALRAEIDRYFEEAPTEPQEDIIAAILPHAGYAYSGRTAAHAVKTLTGPYSRVVIIGPTHQLPMEEMLSVPRVTHYATLLGEVALDVEFIQRLLAYPVFQNVPQAHQTEHSVQIEVPLLQCKLGDFTLVPIVAGQCSYETVARAGMILASLIDADTLVVASSDFTHYGLNYGYVPFTDDVPENLRKLDMEAFAFIANKDARGLLQFKERTHATICGCVPVAVLLTMLGQDPQARMVQYATSGEMMGDYSNSVSYLAVTFSGAWERASAPAAQTAPGKLTDQDKKDLLAVARRTIRYGLDRQRVPELTSLGVEVSEAVRLPRAAFVTLKKHGQLRGCIGDIFPQRPLYQSVIRNAIYAAFGDQRFQPLQNDEYDQIKVEISALTVPSPVSSPQAIRIGTDGMVLNKDGRSAVFLPQVAPEQGWDLETTLQHLSVKAGLPADAWRQGASFQVFQAEVFGEEE